jgi:hypothetical protein
VDAAHRPGRDPNCPIPAVRPAAGGAAALLLCCLQDSMTLSSRRSSSCGASWPRAASSAAAATSPADVRIGAGRSDCRAWTSGVGRARRLTGARLEFVVATERRRQGIAGRFALLLVMLHRELSPSEPLIEELVAPGPRGDGPVGMPEKCRRSGCGVIWVDVAAEGSELAAESV